MDLTTLIGILGGFGLLYWGLMSGEILSAFMNWHGLAIVVGGTFSALLINTPFSYIKETFISFFSVFMSASSTDLRRIAMVLIRCSEQAKMQGIFSLQLNEEEKNMSSGFLSLAIQLSKETNDPEFVRLILDQEIVQKRERAREIENVFRTMATLSPMFGLLGTLIGIIQVLKQLSNPEQIGPSMALAITSAFYGIMLANLVFVPLAGKLRIRAVEEAREMEMILEGIVEIMQGTIPMFIMRKLSPYLGSLGEDSKTTATANQPAKK